MAYAIRGRRAAMWLSALAVVLTAASAVLGLVVDELYGEPLSTASMLRGFDLVTLVVVVPVLGASLLGALRGSLRALLVWVAMLAAVVYTHAYHVFGAGFNDAFLLHAAVFSTTLFALVLALSSLDTSAVAGRLSHRAPVRSVSALLALLAVGLGGMWIARAVRFILTGASPEGSALVETPAVVHLGYALDLVLLVPAYGLAAVLLWRRTGWGCVLAVLLLASGVVQQLGYLVALPFQAAAGVPGATVLDPFEPPIAAAFLIASVALLAGVRRSPVLSRAGLVREEQVVRGGGS